MHLNKGTKQSKPFNQAITMKNHSPYTQTASLIHELISGTVIGVHWQDGDAREMTMPQAGHLVNPKLAEAVHGRLSGLAHAERLAGIPIVGICGTMNSGKSTLAASFLSPHGRARVLIGDYESESTQRFVFWLPESLRHNHAVQECFDEMFRQQFGRPAEPLSDEPKQAASQYNATDADAAKLGVPLIAFDPALDEHHFCFLDCPDIQRPAKSGSLEYSSNIRREALANAVRFCSAFIVVASQQQFASQTTRMILDELRSHASGLPILLALNMASEKVAADIANVEAVLSEWGLSAAVSGIYHAPFKREVGGRVSWPAFCNRDGSDISITTKQLGIAELGKAFVQSSIKDLRTTVEQVTQGLHEVENSMRQKIGEVHKHLRLFLADHFLDQQGHVRICYSPGISDAIIKAITETAPWDVQAALYIHGGVKSLSNSIGSGIEAVWAWVQENNPFGGVAKAPALKNPDAMHSVTPHDFASHMKPHRHVRSDVDAAKLHEVWVAATSAMPEYGSSLKVEDRKKLKQIVAKLWDELPWTQRLLAAVVLPASIITTVLAVLFIPFDMGASVIKLASVSELMTALGVSLLFNQATVQQLTAQLEKSTGLEQVADLFAAIQDGLCLPRQGSPSLHHMPSGKEVDLPKSDISRLPGIITVLDSPVIELDHEAIHNIQQTLAKSSI
jgi:hypothetical protein